jgi:hypothetical protein
MKRRKWLKTNGKEMDKKKGGRKERILKDRFGEAVEIMSKGMTRKATKVRKRRT